MKKTNRAYKRGEPFRDARLFVIVCEGEKREKDYFEYFTNLSQRIKIKVLAPVGDQKGKSAPKWVLDRAAHYFESTGLNNDDQLWIVIDVDKWGIEDIKKIAESCNDHGWLLSISNPCFEVWLYNHIADAKHSTFTNCKDFKQGINKKIKGGYKLDVFVKKIENAIKISKRQDSDKNHYMPGFKETKVYLLVEELFSIISK